MRSLVALSAAALAAPVRARSATVTKLVTIAALVGASGCPFDDGAPPGALIYCSAAE